VGREGHVSCAQWCVTHCVRFLTVACACHMADARVPLAPAAARTHNTPHACITRTTAAASWCTPGRATSWSERQ
jgi:hypothetical protein